MNLPVCYLFPSELKEYRLLCSHGRKIDAIKFLRFNAFLGTSSAVCDDVTGTPTRSITLPLGLREAKEITEVVMENNSDCRFIRVRNPIKSIVVDMGQGETTLSLSDMSLTFVSGLANGSISVETVSSLIDLYNLIKSWEDGLNSNKGN